jgi:hypothetical protein
MYVLPPRSTAQVSHFTRTLQWWDPLSFWKEHWPYLTLWIHSLTSIWHKFIQRPPNMWEYTTQVTIHYKSNSFSHLVGVLRGGDGCGGGGGGPPPHGGGHGVLNHPSTCPLM